MGLSARGLQERWGGEAEKENKELRAEIARLEVRVAELEGHLYQALEQHDIEVQAGGPGCVIY